MKKTLTVLGVVGLVLAITGTATGTIDRLIRGSDVKNGSLTGRDVRNGSLASRDVKNGRLTGRDIRNRSLTGREIRPNSIGPGRLADGSIRLLVRQRLTAINPDIGPPPGIRVVNVPGVGTGSGEPATTGAGAELYPAANLRSGRYLVQGSVIFFDFTGEDTAPVEYGVVQVFLDGTPLLVGTNWSPDIPDDGNNGATASGSFILDVPPGGGTLEVRVVIRSAEADTAPAGQAGGNLIVTKLAAP